MRLFLGIVAISLCFAGRLIAADINSSIGANAKWAEIEIKGEIVNSDVGTFAGIVQSLHPKFDIVTIRLDSPGGDLLAAMKIGDIIRTEWLWTDLSRDANAQCASACVFILAAGAVRIATDHQVSIHRPHFDEHLFSGLGQHDAKIKYDELSRQVEAYLSQMGMSGDLFAAMMKVPSNKIRKLTYHELVNYWLVGKDPGYEEWLRANNVSKYGKQKMLEYDAWLGRESAFVANCIGASQSEDLWRTCVLRFSSRDPSPIVGE